MTQKGIQY